MDPRRAVRRPEPHGQPPKPGRIHLAEVRGTLLLAACAVRTGSDQLHCRPYDFATTNPPTGTIGMMARPLRVRKSRAKDMTTAR
jgi:hypothetical protein